MSKSQATLSEFAEDTTCPTCGRDDFESKTGMRSHHSRIHGESLCVVQRNCKECGKKFETRRTDVNRGRGKYCSIQCANSSIDSYPNSVRRIKRLCLECNDSFSVIPSRLEYGSAEFCSRECHSESMSGEGGPNWKGGVSDSYGRSWLSQRRKALERDNHECALCGLGRGTHKQLFGQDLHVHHKTPFREFGIKNHE